MSSCGELRVPAESTTSRRALATCQRRARTNSTPTARPVAESTSRRVARARLATCRLGRRCTGRRKALAAEQRVPLRSVASVKAKPARCGPLWSTTG